MGSGDGLARVTYLPGVVPPVTREPAPEPAQGAAQETEPWAEAALPDFASFFGERAVEKEESASEPGAGTKSSRRPVRAENVSMHALTRRGMSRWELEKLLLSRELDEETVTAELDRLEGVGLLDDAALAETLVRTQHERKGLGRSAITSELRRRHIEQHHIDAALEQLDDDDEQQRANELAEKRAGQLATYDQETAKRRLTAFLMRKGYSSSVIRIATEQAFSSRISSRDGGGVRFR